MGEKVIGFFKYHCTEHGKHLIRGWFSTYGLKFPWITLWWSVYLHQRERDQQRGGSRAVFYQRQTSNHVNGSQWWPSWLLQNSATVIRKIMSDNCSRNFPPQINHRTKWSTVLGLVVLDLLAFGSEAVSFYLLVFGPLRLWNSVCSHLTTIVSGHPKIHFLSTNEKWSNMRALSLWIGRDICKNRKIFHYHFCGFKIWQAKYAHWRTRGKSRPLIFE